MTSRGGLNISDGHTHGRARAIWIVAIVAALGALALPTARPQATTAADQPCNIPSPTGTRTIPLFDQGQDRPFLFRVPEGYDGHRRLPLILNLHGSGLNRELQMQFSQMEPAADAHGFAVAAPNGAVRSSPATYEWNVPGVPLRGGGPVPAGTPNDEQYLLAVIRAAKHAVCIDTNRIYVAGYSGGGRMSSQLACDYADKIAAIAPVAGLRAGVPDATSDGTWEPIRKTCRPDRPVPILAFHGTADPRNPYDGNGDPSWGYSVETALARWAKINRCERGPRTKITTGSVEKISYRDCQAHGKVGLYRANGAGHTWPGSPFPFPVSLLGTTDQTISATELMLDFFAKHPQEN